MTKIPYEPIGEKTTFLLPDGSVGFMDDIVSIRRGDLNSALRYEAEVKLIQAALGVEPDGIIGPKTRAAARALFLRRAGVVPG
jgi:peptidoglycan hydrolase-like protein with peptidoglycan-binding domain